MNQPGGGQYQYFPTNRLLDYSHKFIEVTLPDYGTVVAFVE